MKMLFLGDIVGKSGRDAVINNVKKLRQELGLDCVIANGENAAHGFGITAHICKELFQAGVDVITTGNHVWDHREILSYIETEKNLLRPLNYPPKTPGQGFVVWTSTKGQKVLIINAMARLFMDPLNDPFEAVDNLLKTYTLGGLVHTIMIDFHGEATSEKQAMGNFCDGRVSLVAGTHTHVPTADHQILPKGTAYISDAGMCGDYNSILGMAKETPLHKFIKKTPPPERMQPSTGEGTLCGVYVETDDSSGLSKFISPVRIGPRLENILPKKN